LWAQFKNILLAFSSAECKAEITPERTGTVNWTYMPALLRHCTAGMYVKITLIKLVYLVMAKDIPKVNERRDMKQRMVS
jgi:hypothetical protein